MHLLGLLCKPSRDRISSAPTFLPSPSHRRQMALPVLIVSASFSVQSDRMVPELDTIVPLESTKAYNMVDIIHSVSATSAGFVCASSATSMVLCFGI